MHILFICTGNVSRSPVAECILRTMAEQAGRNDITVASAGTHDLRGEAYDPKMIEVAARHGFQMQGNAKLMTQAMLLQADHIFVMEQYHYVKVQKDLPYAQWHKLHLINQYCFGKETNVDDPIYGSDLLFEQVFEHIRSCCQIILDRLQL